MYQVVKRDGKIASFDISKISTAITKAFEATHMEYNPDIIDLLALRVTADYQDKIHDGKITVEDIQDSVEDILSKAGYADVAKAYILAGEGELHRDLLRGRPDPLQLRRHHRQLLAL